MDIAKTQTGLLVHKSVVGLINWYKFTIIHILNIINQEAKSSHRYFNEIRKERTLTCSLIIKP